MVENTDIRKYLKNFTYMYICNKTYDWQKGGFLSKISLLSLVYALRVPFFLNLIFEIPYFEKWIMKTYNEDSRI